MNEIRQLKRGLLPLFHALINISFSSEPYSKPLEDGIFELRAKSDTDISRVLYFFVTGNKAVLTNGFIKKTNKTPRNEIELAKKRRNDYLAQNKSKKEG